VSAAAGRRGQGAGGRGGAAAGRGLRVARGAADEGGADGRRGGGGGAEERVGWSRQQNVHALRGCGGVGAVRLRLSELWVEGGEDVHEVFG